MSDKQKFEVFTSKSVSTRLTDEGFKMVNELYNHFYDQPDISFREFFHAIVLPAAMQNTFVGQLPGEQEKELKLEINNLNNDIRTLQEINKVLGTNAENAEKQLEKLKYELEVSDQTVNELLKKTTALEAALAAEKENKGHTVPDGSLFVIVEPVVDHFLHKMASAATKMKQREVKREDILKNLFWDQILYGPGDHLPLVISRSEVAKKVADLKKEQEAKNE